MSEVLDFIAILSYKSGNVFPEIPTLFSGDRGLERIFAREFAVGFYLNKSLDKHPEFFKINGYAPGWIVRLFFKPNMTINANFQIYKQFTDYSKLDHASFSQLDFKEPKQQQEQSRYRNSAGISLNIVSRPDFYEYIGRVLDLEVKFKLYDQIRTSTQSIDDLSIIKNAYYPKSTDRFSKIEGKVCLGGPLEDKRDIRCLTYDI